MPKDVIFIIGSGTFETGFPITLQIREQGRPLTQEIDSFLPPSVEIYLAQQKLSQHYNSWGQGYRWLQANEIRTNRIIAVEGQTTHVSSFQDCTSASQSLRQTLDNWLNDASVRKLERRIQGIIPTGESVRFIIKTSDLVLQRLPWHLWDFFHNYYPESEIIIGTSTAPQAPPFQSPVKILAIFGSDKQIDLRPDKQLLENFLEKRPDIKLFFLEKPSRSDLKQKLISESWDILFFAGHSSTDHKNNTGILCINENSQDDLTIDDLQTDIIRATRNGLKLAIFNSCDGLGIANNLARFNPAIPHIVVMREPIHNDIAIYFFQEFLQSFTKGCTLENAIKEARQSLELHEEKSPCVSWLPIILQNPETPPLQFPKTKIQKSFWLNFSHNLLNSKKSSSIIVVFFLMVCLGGLWLYKNKLFPFQNNQKQTVEKKAIEDRLSIGEKFLIEENLNPVKLLGSKAFQKKEYRSAIQYFKKSLEINKNDPETLIYLNNAQALLSGGYHKLATSVPIGNNPAIAQEILRGIALEQTEINEQGKLKDKQIVIVIGNDDNNPSIAQKLAHHFVKDSSILAIIGHNASDASVAAAPIYQAGGLVMLSPTSFSDRVITLGDHIFRMVPLQSLTNKLATYYLSNSDPNSTIGACYDYSAVDNASFVTNFQNALLSTKVQNGQSSSKVNKIKCNLNDPNLDPEKIIQSMIDDKVDSLLLAPHIDRIDKALEVAKVNHGRLKLYGSTTMFTNQTLMRGKNDVLNLITVVPYFPREDDTFQTKLFKQFGAKSKVWRTATSYDATTILINALQKNPTRSGIAETLHNPHINLQGVTGNISFLQTGDREADPTMNSLITIKVNEKGKLEFRLLPNQEQLKP